MTIEEIVKSAGKVCVPRAPERLAVKFDKSMIAGYDCISHGCGRFDVPSCEECNWNTMTPYIVIGERRAFLTDNGFTVDDDFYILLNDKTNEVVFISEEHFNKTYKWVETVSERKD